MFLNKKDKLQELKDFLDQDTSKEAQEYLTKPSEYWQKEGEKMALNLFHRAAEDVPAYKDYLKKHKIDHKEIKTYEDFKKVPVTTKNDYLKAYPLDKLTWNGNMNDLYMLSSSSGSTGHPFFWPRGETEEIEGALTHEKIFTSFFGVTRNTPTLVVVGFSMGTWIAGPYTLASINYLAKKGYPITTITPGIEKEVFLKLLRDVSPYFKKIILAGYPPFIKDVVDLGPEYGINWKDLNINFLFAGEGFSEKWREHVLKKVGSKDPLTTAITLYGTADAAIVAHETPLTIALRKLVTKDTILANNLFSDLHHLPSILQYDPRKKFFEKLNGSIVFTTDWGIPLIRYSIGDEGGVLYYDEMVKKLKLHNYNPSKLTDGEPKNTLWKLPFVYVFGRKDLTVSFYALLVYPENIKSALEDDSLNELVSGKFTMSTENDRFQNQYLLINIELARNISKTKELEKKVKKVLVDKLKLLNSEYNKLYQSIGNKALPRINLYKNGDPKYSAQGMKQKWVKKN